MGRRAVLARASHGQTLVEAIVVIGVVILLVTGLVAATTASLRSGQNGRVRSQALKYAQEGVELARTLRDTGWTDFATHSGLWCLDNTGTWTAASGSCTVNIDSLYTRSVAFAWNDPKMTVTVTVAWGDSSGTHAIPLVTYFTQWR